MAKRIGQMDHMNTPVESTGRTSLREIFTHQVAQVLKDPHKVEKANGSLIPFVNFLTGRNFREGTPAEILQEALAAPTEFKDIMNSECYWKQHDKEMNALAEKLDMSLDNPGLYEHRIHTMMHTALTAPLAVPEEPSLPTNKPRRDVESRATVYAMALRGERSK